MDLDARVVLPGTPRSAGEARRFVARTLGAGLRQEDVDSAVLVASELVAEATGATGTACELLLQSEGTRLTVRVNGTPASGGPDGRAVRLLEVLCQGWGVDQLAGSRSVWCRLAVRPEVSPRTRAARR